METTREAAFIACNFRHADALLVERRDEAHAPFERLLGPRNVGLISEKSDPQTGILGHFRLSWVYLATVDAVFDLEPP